MEEPQRQIAKKCNAATILSGNYIKQEGWAPNYIETKIGQISRAHLVGVAVQQISEQEFLFDDGTGKISVRSFENNFETPPVGALIRLIGKPREYQDQRYLIPEIVKGIENPLWAKLHQKETSGITIKTPEKKHENTITAAEAAETTRPPNSAEEEVITSETEKITAAVEEKEESGIERVEEPAQQAGQDPHTIIYTLIKTMDEGTGADYEEVVAKSNLENGETIIETLMKEGEVFLIAPGKLKVLE